MFSATDPCLMTKIFLWLSQPASSFPSPLPILQGILVHILPSALFQVSLDPGKYSCRYMYPKLGTTTLKEKIQHKYEQQTICNRF